MSSPSAFIMYTHDDENYEDWVRALAGRLRTEGIDVMLDQYDLRLGDPMAHFMEKGIAEADFVVILVSNGFALKADERAGGAGFETHIATSEILVSGNRRKFIPVFIKIDFTEAPRFLRGIKGIRITNLSAYEKQYDELYETLAQQGPEKPKLGPIKRRAGGAASTAPFDIDGLQKALKDAQKNVGPYYYWDIFFDMKSLSEYSIAEIFDLFKKHTIFETMAGGYKVATPRIFSPAYKKQHGPEIVFESNNLRPTTVNLAEFERLILLNQGIRYSFIQFCDDGRYMGTGKTLSTLTLLLVMLNQIHLEVHKKPEVVVAARIVSSADIKLIGDFDDYPFALKNKLLFEEYEHKAGETVIETTVNSFDAGEMEKLFNRMMETFVSNQKNSESPFLRVDHDAFLAYYKGSEARFARKA